MWHVTVSLSTTPAGTRHRRRYDDAAACGKKPTPSRPRRDARIYIQTRARERARACDRSADSVASRRISNRAYGRLSIDARPADGDAPPHRRHVYIL
ncbi:hypothetical protein EVAR_75410_1 [Eumeta japonica]|uniref:Uncharacterized protein n=1 Tax=Eumeta variegata TaxID=151549 RepID=A0A4C1TMY0_EUMVA|nr:hypothetical protein EVAR_75410_1 [Eumeta japonica]